MRRALTLFSLATMTAIAGCAAPTPPVQVTRFHLGDPIARGEIAVEPRDRTQQQSLEFGRYAAIVRAELERAGFTAAADLARSEQVAVIDVRRGSREEIARRSGVSIGLGGGTFGSGVGVGGGVTIPIGRGRSREVVLTELFVQLKRRSDGTISWEGRAQTEARDGTAYAAPEAAVTKLAQALFSGFPGESGRTITVK